MCNDDFCKYLNLQYDAKENDDFKNAKLFKISQILEISYILVVLVIH
jgi:hypothetical protein